MLVTRPEPGAAETAARVAALGWRPVLAPALILAPRAAMARLPRAQAILLTSRAAARALTPPDPCPPIIAVGAATAAEAAARGFPAVEAADGGDAAALAAHVAATRSPADGPLLLAVGAGYGRALEAALRGRGFRVLRRVVYAARPATTLPEPARAAVAARQVRAALFLSPRSATTAIALLRGAGLGGDVAAMDAICISERVAQAAMAAAAPHRWHAMHIAPRPDQAAVLQLLGHAPA